MNYFNERDQKNIEKAREITHSYLPYFAGEFLIGIQQRTSPLTRLGYAQDLKVFFNYLSEEVFNIPVKDITIEHLKRLTSFDIELYMAYLSSYTLDGKKHSCGERAKERKLCSIRSFFHYFFKRDLLPVDITHKVDMPKRHEKAIIRLESNEVNNLLDNVDSDYIDGFSERENSYHSITRLRDRAMLTLFLSTGIRISECVGLNLKDFNFSNNSFCVTRKGGSQSILYFNEETADVLMEYFDWLKSEKINQTKFANKITDMDAAFLSLQGNRITVRAVENMVKKYSKTVTPLKKITPHKLRSTFGTQLYRNTQDIYVVADVLGHKDINTTKKHYAAMSDEIRRQAAKQVKLRDSNAENSELDEDNNTSN